MDHSLVPDQNAAKPRTNGESVSTTPRSSGTKRRWPRVVRDIRQTRMATSVSDRSTGPWMDASEPLIATTVSAPAATTWVPLSRSHDLASPMCLVNTLHFTMSPQEEDAYWCGVVLLERQALTCWRVAVGGDAVPRRRKRRLVLNSSSSSSSSCRFLLCALC